MKVKSRHFPSFLFPFPEDAMMFRGRIACLLAGCLLLGWFAPSRRLDGAEKHMEFLEGLRDQRYFDYAVLFLEQLEQRTDIDPALKEVIPFEKAKTLLEGAQYQGSPEAMQKQLDTARLFLEQFLKASPDHAESAQASADLAQVLVRKGRVELIQSRNPSNAAVKVQFQQRARGYFAEARKMFQTAYDKYLADYKQYPTFIDPVKDKVKHAAREKALANYVQASFNVTLTWYDESQTYEKEDPKYTEILLQAANDFEKIHQEHRSVLAGLYARMYQGKCFEEMQDITKALGIYDELLDHGQNERPDFLQKLQDHVLQFKLICLNHDQRKDYQVVAQTGADWLKSRQDRYHRTSVGLGIRWEIARADEQLALKSRALADAKAREKEKAKEKPKSKEKPKEGEAAAAESEDTEDVLPHEALANADALMRLAQSHARYVARFPSEYRAPAEAMLKRIDLFLEKESGDPKTFDSAFSAAQTLVKGIPAKRKEFDDEKADKAAKQTEYAAYVAETIRILKLALNLAKGPQDVSDPKNITPINDVNRVRYFLSFAYYSHPSRHYSYDASIIAEYVAKKYADIPGTQSLDSAFLAMSAAQQGYATSDKDDKEFDIGRVMSIAKLMTEKWPNEDKTNDARINLGDMCIQISRPLEAVVAYGGVPDTAPQYNEAHLRMGRAYWNGYLADAFLPEEKRGKKEEVATWPALARKTIEESIAKLEAKLPEGAGPDENITLAKVDLVQMLNLTGDYPAALKVLTEGPRSVFEGVKSPDGKEESRPKRGARSVDIASAAHREALRAYVGSQQVDKARAELKELEKIGGGGEGLTRILVQLGKKLEEEINRDIASANPQLPQKLQSFENFLGDLFNRKEGQDFHSLMWVGQTYISLGQAVEKSDATRATTYFSNAGQAYQALLERGSADAKFIPEGATPGVKLKLVTARRKERKFDEAHTLITELLTAGPMFLDGQSEAALIYESRAAQGGPDDWKYYKLANDGDRPKSGDQVVWGWKLLAQKLANAVQNQADQTRRDQLKSEYFDTQLHVATCHFKYGMALPKMEDKERNISYARRTLEGTASQTGDFGDQPQYEQFNELYKTVQQELLAVLTALKREDEYEPTTDLPKKHEKSVEAPKKRKVAATPKATAKAKAPPPKPGFNYTAVILGGLVLLGGLACVALLFRKPTKKSVLPETLELPGTRPPAKRVRAKSS